MKEYSAGAIIFRRIGREILFLLVFSRKNGSWGFPKGHREDGEDLHDTVYREVAEETGITGVSFIEGFREELVYPIVSRRPTHEGKPAEKHSVYFLCETPVSEVNVDKEEITDYQWLPYEQAHAALVFSGLKSILSKAMRLLNPEGLGSQSGF